MTPGDPEGIGPEVGVVAAAGQSDLVLLGKRALWERAAALRGISMDSLRIIEPGPPADPSLGGLAEMVAVAEGVAGCLSGDYRALVTGPVDKRSLKSRGFHHLGHTPYLAELCGLPVEEAVMLFSGGVLNVALATVHCPLSEVPALLSEEAILRAARAGVAMLIRAGVTSPKIAVCGLNPHAGEGGRLGSEDAQIIAPAVVQLRSEGFVVDGPLPADTLFPRAAQGRWDLVVAMYHDQGLIPVKTLDFGRSVNITAGLPIIRTSVDHGTARDIAWKGVADAGHTRAAIDMARSLSAAV